MCLCGGGIGRLYYDDGPWKAYDEWLAQASKEHLGFWQNWWTREEEVVQRLRDGSWKDEARAWGWKVDEPLKYNMTVRGEYFDVLYEGVEDIPGVAPSTRRAPGTLDVQ